MLDGPIKFCTMLACPEELKLYSVSSFLHWYLYLLGVYLGRQRQETHACIDLLFQTTLKILLLTALYLLVYIHLTFKFSLVK